MMLRPSKYSHPDRTLLNVSVILLAYLKEHQLAKFDTLLSVCKQNVESSELLFLPALNFLYLLGLIEYHPKTDVVEYVGPLESFG
jgi:hypothetical protein